MENVPAIAEKSKSKSKSKAQEVDEGVCLVFLLVFTLV